MLIKRYLILVTQTDYNTKITEIESTMPIITDLVTTAARNTKSARTESKMSDVTNLATKAAPIQKLKKLKINYLILLIF